MSNIEANIDFGGTARAGQEVSVYTHATTTFVPIFDADGDALDNPLTVRGNGHVIFYAPAGSYDLVGPDLTRTVVLSEPPSVGSEEVGLWVPAGWGQAWQVAKAGAATGKATVAALGHSLTRGFSANLDVDGWVAKIRTALQTAHGDGGSGWRGVVDSQLVIGSSMDAWANRCVFSAGWSYYTGSGKNDGPGATIVIGDNTAGRTVTFPGIRGTALTVYVLRAPGNGSFTVSVDGGAESAPHSTDGALGPLAVALPAVGSGAHTVRITTVGGAGVVLFGVSGENAHGVVVNNYGKSSGNTDDFLGDDAFGHTPDWNGGASYPADLVIINLDGGDILIAKTADDYLANLRTLCESLRSVASPPDLLFVNSHIGKLDTTSIYHAYCARVRALAETYGAAYVNAWAAGKNSWEFWESLGHWGIDSTTAGAEGTSDVHLSTAGQEAMFNLVSRVPGLL